MKTHTNPLKWYYQEQKVENAVPANLVSKMDGLYKTEPFNDGRPGAQDHTKIPSRRGEKLINQYEEVNGLSKLRSIPTENS